MSLNTSPSAANGIWLRHSVIPLKDPNISCNLNWVCENRGAAVERTDHVALDLMAT
jgi:hypothetical protein